MKWRFDQPAQLEGRFWRPDDDSRFYGRVDHAANGTRVHFVDSTLIERYGERPPPKLGAVYGETMDAGAVTLLGVHPTQWRSVAEGANAVDAFVEALLAGDHVPDLDDTMVRAASVTVHGLRETFGGAWPEAGLLSPRGGPRGNGESLHVDLAPGVRLEVGVSELSNVHRGRAQPRQAANAWVIFDQPRPLAEVEAKFLEPLRDFVLFATRRPSHLTSLSLYRDAELRDHLRLLRRPHPRPTELAEREVDALALNLRHVEDPAALLVRWFELRGEIGPVWSVLFSTLQSTAVLEDRFLSLVAFTEGYHRALHDQPPLSDELDKQTKRAILTAIEDSEARRVYRQALSYANSQTLRERLTQLGEWTLDTICWEPDVETFCAQVVHTRNWMVHWGKRGQHTVEDAQQIVGLLNRLELVLYVNVMLDLGMTPEEVAKGIGSGWRFQGLP